MDTHGALEQKSEHIYHLTVCQDDYWIKITIWHFSFSVLAQWTEGKLLLPNMPLSRLLITDLRAHQSVREKPFGLFFHWQNITLILILGRSDFTNDNLYIMTKKEQFSIASLSILSHWSFIMHHLPSSWWRILKVFDAACLKWQDLKKV